MGAKDFQILNRLGEGSYSSVFKVKRLSDGKEYAMKRVKMGGLNQKEIQNALNEVRILASIRSPHVIRYKEAFLDDDSTTLCIIMELAAGGDLYNLIQQRIKTKTSFSEREIWQALIEVTKALKVLHDNQILHRDLKCANVFLGLDGTAKLGDLNVSKITKNNLAYSQAGTPYYASPEIWSDRPYNAKSDIWSLGCVFYEMAALKPPFLAKDTQGLYKKIQRGLFDRIPNQYSADLSNVISWCLQKSPSSRPSCDQLLNSPLLSKYLKYDQFAHTPEKSHLNLLDTIRLPKNMKALNSQLPKANYAEHRDSQESLAEKSTDHSNFSTDRRRSNSACQKGKASPVINCPVQSDRIKRKVPTESSLGPQNRLPPLVNNKQPVRPPNNNMHKKLVEYFNSGLSENDPINQLKAIMPKYKVFVAPEKNPYHIQHAKIHAKDSGLQPSSRPQSVKKINENPVLVNGALNSPKNAIIGQIRHRNDSSAIASLIAHYEPIVDKRQQFQQANNCKVRAFRPILWA